MRLSTPSFVTEIPLKTSSWEESILRKRFWAAKQQYNALLAEALKRLNGMRRDPRFLHAVDLRQQSSRKQEAKALFKQLAIDYSYREYDLYSYCKQWNKKGKALSVGARISQQLAKRAFQAVEAYRLKKRGKPRFKGLRGLNSLEDNSIDANLRLKGHVLHYLGLQLPLLYNPHDPIHYHGLHSKIKYARIVKRYFNGRVRYFAQLTCEGKPWIKSKNTVGNATVGLDIGPQTIAIVSPGNQYASLHLFADELSELKQKKKALQRKLARQLRAGNPACFEVDVWIKKDKQWQRKKGKSLKGKNLLNRSNSLQKTQAKLADLARKEAAFRKSQHGKLINKILSQGAYIKTEKLNYKVFQQLYGKSVGLRAPGLFVAQLKRKAENAGEKVEEINTWQTALSQICHCGKKEKKPLSQRWHRCSCGVTAQRDLYSAYLASFVEKNQLMVDQAQKAWSGMDIALCTAIEKLKQASSGHLPTSLGLNTGSELVVHAVS